MNSHYPLIMLSLTLIVCTPESGWAGANTNAPYCEHDPDCWEPIEDPSMIRSGVCCRPTCFRCVGDYDYCGPTGGTCEWTGSWVCVNAGDCNNYYSPSSTRHCVQSDEPYRCVDLSGDVLRLYCRSTCRVVPFVSCTFVGEKSDRGVFTYLTDCREEAK